TADTGAAGGAGAALLRRLLLPGHCRGARHPGGDRHVAAARGPPGPGRDLPKGAGMTPIESVELSALLDGELPARRAGEVRAAPGADPALAATFERLAALDTSWKADAARLAFRPRASLRRGLLRRFLRAACLMVGLVGLRLAVKLALPSV